jgi:hypothetical protein
LEQDGIVVWWRWEESNPLHQNGCKYMKLKNNYRILKLVMGQV